MVIHYEYHKSCILLYDIRIIKTFQISYITWLALNHANIWAEITSENINVWTLTVEFPLQFDLDVFGGRQTIIKVYQPSVTQRQQSQMKSQFLKKKLYADSSFTSTMRYNIASRKSAINFIQLFLRYGILCTIIMLMTEV